MIEPEQTWLTITDIARRLDARESTVRSWRDRYPQYVPPKSMPDGRCYSLERILAIKQLQESVPRLSVREIRAKLASRYPNEASEKQVLAESKRDTDEQRELVKQAIARMDAFRVQVNAQQLALLHAYLAMEVIKADIVTMVSDLNTLSADRESV